MGKYIAISVPLDFSTALYSVSIGEDAFAINQDAAYDLAAACAPGKFPYGPEIDKGKEYTIGYYWHYHPNPRTGSHVFYLT